MPQRSKSGRPLGVSLAILTSGLLFSVAPLFQIGLIVLLRLRIQELSFATDDGTVIPIASGGTLSDISNVQLALQFGIGVGFLVVTIFAWRGRPYWVRYVLILFVLFLLAFNLISRLDLFSSDQNFQTGLDSSETLQQALSSVLIGLESLVTLYVVWYLNRAPARRFYHSRSANED